MRTHESNLIHPCGPDARPQPFDALTPPSWITQWIGAIGGPHEWTGDNWIIEQGDVHGYAQWSVRDAADLSDSDFEAAVAEAYQQLARLIDRHGLGTPVRLWNFVPRIHADAPSYGDRYMVFNAGRRRAFMMRTDAPFDTRLIPASAVDHHGRDFVIQALTAPAPPRPIENPRQRPAYHYSHRYGEVPPSFARAGVIGEERSVITAGTASIIGEDSWHEHDLAQQLREIEINLATLIAVADGTRPDVARVERDFTHRHALLRTFGHVRAYVVSIHDRAATKQWMRCAFPRSTRREIVLADLCRPGLRVEVEGLAMLGPVTGTDRPPERA